MYPASTYLPNLQAYRSPYAYRPLPSPVQTLPIGTPKPSVFGPRVSGWLARQSPTDWAKHVLDAAAGLGVAWFLISRLRR